MIRDHGDDGLATWAVVSQVQSEFFNERLRATYATESDPGAAAWPWNCGGEPWRGEPPLAQLRVTATADRIVASDFRIISSGVAPEVVECLESYYAGETVIERREGDPEFLALETRVEAPAFNVRLEGGATSDMPSASPQGRSAEEHRADSFR